jgi:extracellular factor (EF) 3-hydroxypalmitic acid methyl ester biosynthesis protein
MPITTGKDTFIVCRNSQGTEFRATLLKLSRYMVVFEVYNPYSIIQLSEVLTDFRLIMNDRMVYSGRAVVSNLLNTGIMVVCEATLANEWLDVDLFTSMYQKDKLKNEFTDFLKELEKVRLVVPDFKVVVADMQTLLMDLRRWLEQVELGICSEPSKNRNQMEREIIQELNKPVIQTTTSIFERFEEVSMGIQEDLQPIHRAYVKRHLHPLVLCSPFLYRTFQKPLGYAGDYEMVNMMLRDPLEGGSIFAKMLNVFFLDIAPCAAHRNRIGYLKDRLKEETYRVFREGRNARVLNMGCGPAREIQSFMAEDEIADKADFLLLDFNDETLEYTRKTLEDIRIKSGRHTQIQAVKKSVNQILKETFKPLVNSPEQRYDFIYCAGLFDYLSDRICKRLMGNFYQVLAPGGLLIATNVDKSNPNRGLMEFISEWHLVYRNSQQLKTLIPEEVLPECAQVKADITGVNIFIEVRKPDHD